MKEKEELLSQIENVYDSNERNVSISLNGVKYPDYWCDQYTDHLTFEVPQHSSEFKRIAKEFKKGMPQAKIDRIERNQNRTLWYKKNSHFRDFFFLTSLLDRTFYFLKNQLISNKNNYYGNEQFLFHGSRTDAYEVIMKEGFDHRVANLNGAIGAGIYFATSSSTSSGYTNSSRWNNTRRMLYCRVTLGNVGPGSAGLRRPPAIPGKKGSLYDSVGNATMYVIFDNEQAYPEYCIYYR